MFRLIVVVLCLLAPGLAAPNAIRLRSRADGRIIGGSTTSISSYPWQLALLSGGSQICGASIISSNWVLTAAHCVEGAYVSSLSVRAGSSNRNSGGSVLSISSGYINADFSMNTLDYDVAVLQTSSAFPLGSNVAIVSLPSDGYDPPSGLAVTITGWGNTYTGGGSPTTLQKVDINIIARATCRSNFASIGTVTDRMVCAGQAGKSVCNGDSGGPLVSGSTQVGIVSWGQSRCENSGAVYSSVGNLRSWIRSAAGV